jgi:hypothetical protein
MAEETLMALALRYHHLGIPTSEEFAGSQYLPALKMTVSDHTATPYGIQWMRFDDDCTFPELVKRFPHVAFEVDDLREAIRGKKVIIEPNEPAPGTLVAFIEEAGATIEFLQFSRKGAPKPPLQTPTSVTRPASAPGAPSPATGY